MVSKYRWVILCLGFLAFGVSVFPRMVYPPLIPEMSFVLDLTHTEAGMLMSGFFISYVAVQIPIGFIADKVGVKRVFTVSLLLVGVLCILTGFATSFIDGFTLRFLNGFAAGCIFAPGSALVLRWFPPKDRALAISLFTVSNVVATVIVLAFSAVVSSIFGGWMWSFWIFGVPAIIIAVLSFFLLKEKPEDSFVSDTATVRASIRAYYCMILRDFRVWFLSLAGLAGATVNIGSLTWIPTYLVSSLGLSEVYAGSMTSIIAFTGIIAVPFGGYVADRVLKKRSPVVFFGTFGSGLACILFSFLKPTGFYPTIALFVIIIFLTTFWWILPSLLSDWLPLNVMGTASGFVNFMTMIGSIIGPFIFGYILDFTGSFSFGWLVLGCIASILSLPMLSVMFKESTRV